MSCEIGSSEMFCLCYKPGGPLRNLRESSFMGSACSFLSSARPDTSHTIYPSGPQQGEEGLHWHDRSCTSLVKSSLKPAVSPGVGQG